MYLRHFGLEKNPFSLTPDPRFLFLTTNHREALAALFFAVTERKGFTVLTGDAGTGKTTLVRKLLLSIPLTGAQFSVIVNPALTRSEFLESVLMEFGEPQVPSSKALRLDLLKKLLLRVQAQGRTSVLVIDEAHLLTGELLDEVRLLSNFETSEQKLLQIILVGQNELDTLLTLDSLRQVKQRIAIRVHVDPLADTDIKRYLQTRWNRAAAQRPLPFLEDAIQLITQCSGGIPRVVNVICDAALVNAYGTGAITIGASQVQEALGDLKIAPTAKTAQPLYSVGAAPATQELRSADRTVDRVVAAVPGWQDVAIKRKDPKLWNFGNWFRTASNEAE